MNEGISRRTKQQYIPINQSLKAGVSFSTMSKNHSNCLILTFILLSQYDLSFRTLWKTWHVFAIIFLGIMNVFLQLTVANDSSRSISHHGHYVDNDHAPLRPPNHRSSSTEWRKEKVEQTIRKKPSYSRLFYNTRKRHPNVSSKKVYRYYYYCSR